MEEKKTAHSENLDRRKNQSRECAAIQGYEYLRDQKSYIIDKARNASLWELFCLMKR